MSDQFSKAIEELREKYPPLMTFRQYMDARDCTSRSTVYEDIKKIPGLAVKPFGPDGQVRLLRDVWLDHLAASALITQPAE